MREYNKRENELGDKKSCCSTDVPCHALQGGEVEPLGRAASSFGPSSRRTPYSSVIMGWHLTYCTKSYSNGVFDAISYKLPGTLYLSLREECSTHYRSIATRYWPQTLPLNYNFQHCCPIKGLLCSLSSLPKI
jgi:hypothetical protein